MKNRLRSTGILLAGALLFSSLGVAQTSTSSTGSTAKKSDSSEDIWYKYSFGVFGGIQAWDTHQLEKANKFAPGGALGFEPTKTFSAISEWKKPGHFTALTICA